MVARLARNALTLLLKCRLRSSWEVLLRSYELKGTSRELRSALDVTPIFERTQRYSRHARASMPAKVCRSPLLIGALFIRECGGLMQYLDVERSRHMVTLAQASSKRVVQAMFTKWWGEPVTVGSRGPQ
jgi:hypothetical protein